MECPDPGVIATYIENELAGAERRAVEAHADVCGDCRQLISQLARFAALGSGGEQLLEITRGLRNKDALAATLPHALESDAGPPPGSVMGRYIVLYRLGKGGMGIVLAAYDPELDRKVALKILNGPDDDHRELVREARALAKLAHENVVVVHDVGAALGRVFVAMEYVDGGDLRSWLASAERPWREVMRMFLAAGRGLAASHRAGLVHRDVKPANVLVSTSGRVLVTDFGLARAADASTLEDTSVAGTPAYMSPEQIAGAPADERSDQYSFCASLFEALYHTRPYPGATLAELARSQTLGVIVDPPAHSTVPAAIRRALVRGLAKRRGDRFPSMDALLAALDGAARRRRARWLALAAVPVVAAGVVAFVALRGEDVCTGAQLKIDEVWNPGVQGQIDRAFAATHKPFAAAAWRGVKATLDGYTAAWVDAHVDACRATSVRREQSAEVLDLRMQCLDGRRNELRAVLDVLAHADGDVVQHATDTVGQLGAIASCADIAALRSPVPVSPVPAVRAQLAAVREQLARALALSESGKFEQGLAIVPRVLAAARAVGYQPLEAEALFVRSDLEAEAGDDKASVASLRASVIAAEASGHQLAAAKAWTGLLVRLGVGLGNYTEALQAGEHARAILGRLDPRGLDAAHLEHALGAVLREKGDLPAARAALGKALAIYERELPRGDVRIARTYNDLGNIEWNEQHLDKAAEIFEHVRADVERAMGPDHPMVAVALGNLSNVRSDQGNYAAAMTALQRSLAIEEAAYGPDHPELVRGLDEMGNLAADLGHEDEALRWYQRALALAQKAYGSAHRVTCAVLVNISIIERHRNELAAARAHLEQALAGDEQRAGPDHPEVATTLANLVSLALDEGKLDEAARLAQRVLAIRLKAFEPEHPDVARAYNSVANVALAGGHYADAIAALGKALAIQTKRLGAEHPSLATTLYNLAAAHESLGKLGDAEAELQRGLAILEARVPDDPRIADFLTMQARILLVQHRAADAAPLAERALGIRERTKVEPGRVARTQDVAARALWPRDKARAQALATKALAGYNPAGHDPEARKARADLVAWMKARGLSVP
jgi:eukaryotic-like serine/threonine-protein kinase